MGCVHVCVRVSIHVCVCESVAWQQRTVQRTSCMTCFCKINFFARNDNKYKICLCKKETNVWYVSAKENISAKKECLYKKKKMYDMSLQKRRAHLCVYDAHCHVTPAWVVCVCTFPRAQFHLCVCVCLCIMYVCVVGWVSVCTSGFVSVCPFFFPPCMRLFKGGQQNTFVYSFRAE